ncbi:hypothetical protein [Lentzea xinjiangensis]|uniref:hypothetical protein n=1 Tax=Lentzea xinjiangensis TaxID=402600 RepID=UPI000B7D1DA4|nr:hypothetical protein [Lentzea xinjiangensis]
MALNAGAKTARAAAPGIDVTTHVGWWGAATTLIEESCEARLMVRSGHENSTPPTVFSPVRL